MTYNGKIFNIPSTAPFLETIALDYIKNGSIDDIIMLPTRRSCRELKEKLFKLNNSKNTILPKILPFGEVDEDDLYFKKSLLEQDVASLEISGKKTISIIERTLLLSQFIIKKSEQERGKDDAYSWDKSISLAFELGKLMDSLEIEEIPFSKIKSVYPEEYGDQHKNVIKLLEVVDEFLENTDMINLSKRKVEAIKEKAKILSENNSAGRIILAGSTASQPATKYLIKSILALKNGVIILPNLDKNISEESWLFLNESHSQYGLKSLLNELEITRAQVEDLNFLSIESAAARELFISRIMSEQEDELKSKESLQNSALKNIRLVKSPNNSTEAEIIAISIADKLYTADGKKKTNKKITFVSPDRSLTKRVKFSLKTYGIIADDSAGLPLNHTDLGRFLLTTINIFISSINTFEISSLLENKFTKQELKDKNGIKTLIDLCFRNSGIYENFDDISRKINTLESEKIELNNSQIKDSENYFLLKNISLDDIKIASNLIENLATFSRKIASIKTSKILPFNEILDSHISFLEKIIDPKKMLESHEFKSLYSILSEIKKAMSETDIKVNIFQYSNILESFLNTQSIRPKHEQSDVSILGPIEARLIESDYLIIGGLNEGIYPQNLSKDVFLNDSMRKEIGLPTTDKNMGIASHDFAMLINSAEEVLLTYSEKRDELLTIPSKWILKINSIIKRENLDLGKSAESQINNLIKLLAQPFEFAPIGRAQFNPPIEMRPKNFSATNLEKALKDPYIIFAKYVLNLYKKNSIYGEIQPFEFGKIAHKALENFTLKGMKTEQELNDDFKRLLIASSIDETTQIFHESHFKRFAKWFVNSYESKRTTKESFLEVLGEYEINGINFNAKADRIDLLNNGTFEIIDYKTATLPSKKDLISGEKPQLPMEALILQKGIYKNFGSKQTVITGGTPSALSIIGFSKEMLKGNKNPILINSSQMQYLIDKTERGLEVFSAEFLKSNRNLISCTSTKCFDDRYNDYEYFERVKEWRKNV